MTFSSVLKCNGHAKYHQASVGAIPQLKAPKPSYQQGYFWLYFSLLVDKQDQWDAALTN